MRVELHPTRASFFLSGVVSSRLGVCERQTLEERVLALDLNEGYGLGRNASIWGDVRKHVLPQGKAVRRYRQ